MTTAFAVRNVHPAAGPFYRLFPSEPVPPAGSKDFLTITDVVDLADNQIETLLNAIVAAKVPRNDLETAKRLKFGTFNAAANPTGIKQLNDLKALMKKVRDLELSRVDLRACNTGKEKDTLRQLQFFFNADLCCAPNAYDSFGPIPFADLTSNPTSWKEFREQHPDATIEGVGSERFALSYNILGDEHKVMLDAIADSDAAVRVWVKNHLPPGTYRSGPLYYHGLTADQKTMIFAGEPGYRERLIAVTDGKGAQRVTIDPNAPLER